jgi:hypothetical protein
LAPSAFPAAAASVETALRRLDSFRAEAVILLAAVLIALVPAVMRSGALADRTWAIDPAQGLALTPAGWYATVISSSLLWFLLLRWLWRHLVWSLLLRSLARLDLRLVATHPDRNGGLAFIGQYPNAFALLVLGMSSIVGAALANGLSAGEVTPTIFGWVMTLWLAIILALFAVPLSAFSRPLHKLKEETQLACSSAATRWHRANEREVLGRNIVACADAAEVDKGQLQNPSAIYADVGRLSTVLLKRSAVVPVGLAALLPLALAGATVLPYREVLAIARRLILI